MSTLDSTDDEPLFDERITGYPWPIAVLSGLLTFVVGYVVMGVVVLASGTLDADAEITAVVVDVGMVFYNAHNAVIDVQVQPGVVYPGPRTIDTLSGSTTLPTVVYYAVPVLTLAVAGALVARATLRLDADWMEAALPVVGMPVGYTVFAVLATFVVRSTQAEGAVTLVPNLVQTTLFGLVYSIVCVAVGSLAVVTWRRRDELLDRAPA